MERNPKKSKALIITIILVLLLVITGYFIFKNMKNVGSNTSSGIAKIFSPLTTSNNSKDLTTVTDGLSSMIAKAGEDINEGDSVYVSSLDINNNPTVLKATGSGKYIIWGKALNNIKAGSYGNFSKDNNGGSWWGTIKNWFTGGDSDNNNGDNDNNDNNTCTNGATNPTLCTTIDNKCINDATNPPLCTNFDTNIFPTVTVTASPASIAKGESSTISWTSTNSTSCDAGTGNGTGTEGSFSTGILQSGKSFTVTCTGTNGTGSGNVIVSVGKGICLNGATNPPTCTDGANKCANGTDNFPTCTTINGACLNGADNPEACTSNPDECTNGTDNFPTCTTINGECINGATNPPSCTTTNENDDDFPSVTVTADPTTVDYKGTSTISWTSENTVSCDAGIAIDAVDGNTSSTEGSFQTDKLTKSMSYTVVCKGKGNTGKISGTAYVYVNPEIITVKPECSDGVDNDDKDTLADIDDPECHLGGIITNKYIADWYSEDIPASEVTYQCNDGEDNDRDGKTDIQDPGCHTDGVALDPAADQTGGENDSAIVDKYNPSTYDPTRGEWDSIPTPHDGDTECSDGDDNDGDQTIDEGDVNCHIGGIRTGKYIAKHDDESNPPTQCDDTIDNDKDGDKDEDDSGCHTGYDASNITDYDATLNNEARKKVETTSDDENICLVIEENPLTFTDEEKARLEVLLRKFYLISSTLRTSEDIATIYSTIEQEKDFIGQIEDLTKQCYLEINDTAGYKNFCSRNSSKCLASDTYAGTKYHDTYYTAGQNLIQRRGNPWYMPSYYEADGTFPYSLKDNYRLTTDPNSVGYTDYNWLEENYSPFTDKYGNLLYDHPTDASNTGPGCKAVSGYYYGKTTSKIGSCPSNSGGRTAYITDGSCHDIGTDCSEFNTLNNKNCNYINAKWLGNTSAQPDEGILNAGCKWKEGVDLTATERILNIW